MTRRSHIASSSLRASLLAALLALPMAAHAAGSSAHYAIPASTVDAGGQRGSSAHYSTEGHVASPAGIGSSAAFGIDSGFFAQTIPPETTITSGPSGTVASASATFTFNANDAATFTYSLDGGATARGAGPVTFNGLAQGAHTFSVFATDTSGIVDATPATRTWTVDTVAPETTITSGPSGTVASRSATFAYSANEAATFTYSLDGGATATGAGPVTFSGLAQGAHSFSVFATDTAGNADATPATRTWTVQLDPASTEIAAKGLAVPGAGANGIPAGAVWVSFGVPSINDAGQCTVLATYKAGTVSTVAILGWNLADMAGTMRIVVKKGAAAPGIANAVMSTLGEPLLGPDGSVAWLSTLANAPTTTGAVTVVNNAAIFLDADGAGAGVASIVARKGPIPMGMTDW